MKIITERILETGKEKIREKDLISIQHKDGRPIRGRLTEIRDSMIGISQSNGTEMIYIASIESAKKVG